MQGKIAVEEHFAIGKTAAKSVRFPQDAYWAGIEGKLIDLFDRRLAEMDACGIGLAVLSLNANGIQEIPEAGRAVELAREANDALADAVAKRPDRFAGLAALPMQDPDAAAAELQRCVRDLKFRGALVNGFSQVGTADSAVYYDLPQYRPFWAEVERLNAPFYLHPRYSLPSRRQRYEGHSWMVGSPWDFAEETAIHALRLMGSGLFYEFPKLKIIIGHLGERIPFDLWRLDHRLKKLPDRPNKRPMADYFRQNFYITTSGNFCTQSLIQAMLTVGADRMLFAVDYPFEDHEQAAAWFDGAEIAEHDRIKIGRDNAKALFNLAWVCNSDCSFMWLRGDGRGTAIMLACYGNRAGSRLKENDNDTDCFCDGGRRFALGGRFRDFASRADSAAFGRRRERTG
jgi:2,3-dihydroxybenzoate decarboxylase